jgi:hypothetical protein
VNGGRLKNISDISVIDLIKYVVVYTVGDGAVIADRCISGIEVPLTCYEGAVRVDHIVFILIFTA